MVLLFENFTPPSSWEKTVPHSIMLNLVNRMWEVTMLLSSKSFKCDLIPLALPFCLRMHTLCIVAAPSAWVPGCEDSTWNRAKVFVTESFPVGSDGKESTCNAGDLGPWVRKNPLQYSCLENSMDRRAWRTAVHGVTKSWTWLSG